MSDLDAVKLQDEMPTQRCRCTMPLHADHSMQPVAFGRVDETLSRLHIRARPGVDHLKRTDRIVDDITGSCITWSVWFSRAHGPNHVRHQRQIEPCRNESAYTWG